MATELNIIDLIEHNPITKLSDTYNITLLRKIKSAFSDQEQQLFVSSFYCYLNYDTVNDFVVNLDAIWKWVGFSQKINAIRLLDKHFKNNLDYKKTALLSGKAVLDDEKKNGGQNIITYWLTIKCFKSLCLKAQTKKAGEIHEYYMKLEELLHEVIEEEAIEFKKQLTQKTEQLMQKTEQLEQKTAELKVVPEQEKHKLIMKQYGTINGSLIYVARIKILEDDTYIIKIGESRRGVRNRHNEFKQKYGSQVIFLDAFLVNNSAGFEKFLHTHDQIRPSKVTNLKGHESENELFLIGKNLSYQTVVQLIDANISSFEYSFAEYEKLKSENEKLHLEIQMLKDGKPVVSYENEIKELIALNKSLITKVTALEEYTMQKKTEPAKTMTKFDTPDSHTGPRLQKIHPETLQLIHVYETVTDAMKENSAIKRPSINKAVRENTVYQGFRWQLVDRELDPQMIYKLEPTKKTRPQNLGYIAKVNKEKTEILNIYIDRKTAAVQNGYGSSSLDTPVKNGALTNGYYYMLLDSCEDYLKEKWTEKHGECILYKDGVGQYDSDNKIIKEFTCKYDCMTQLKISQKSMAKALDKDVMYDKCYYKSLGSKMYV